MTAWRSATALPGACWPRAWCSLRIVWIAVRHAGISIGFRRPRLTPNVKRLLVLAFPAAITGGITQINQLIGTAIASGKDSAVSSLAYADRVYQLPLGVVGIAVGHRAAAGTGARAESRQSRRRPRTCRTARSSSRCS